MRKFLTIFSYYLHTCRMSLLKYFKKSEKTALDPGNLCKSTKNDFRNNITANELEKVQESLKVAREEKKKRTVYAEKDKQEIARYAVICGVKRLSENSNQISQT